MTHSCFIWFYFFFLKENTYVEFVDLTGPRKGPFISDENQAEKIINDIVFMDAAYDLSQLPDLSAGISIHFRFNIIIILFNLRFKIR